MNIAAIDETVPTSPQVSIRLEKKHPLAIRWMHWINFPVLFTMIWSGLLIYWNDSDNAYQHPHRVYRVGISEVIAAVIRLTRGNFRLLVRLLTSNGTDQGNQRSRDPVVGRGRNGSRESSHWASLISRPVGQVVSTKVRHII